MNRRDALRTLAAGSAASALAGGIAMMATPSAAAVSTRAAPHPDAELIHLGHELEAAWKAENAIHERLKGDISDEAEAQMDASTDLSSDVVERIEALTATTLEGVLVKVLAVSWCHCGDAFENDTFGDETDVRLVSAILRDLSAMRGAAQ